MNLDTGHPIGHRRRLVVGETERGDTNQDQLALEQMTIDLSGENVGRRDEARRVGPREVYAHAAIGLGGNGQISDLQRFDTRRTGADGHHGAPSCDAEHLDAERGNQRVTDGGDEGHPPHHASLGVHAQETVPLDDTIDFFGAVERSVEPAHERSRVAADGSKWHSPDTASRPGHLCFQTGNPEHDPRRLEGARENRIVARQAGQPLNQVLAHAGHEFRQACRREPICLGHQDVDADRGGIGFGDAGHQLGEPGPRPRPLPVQPKALLVDGHDDGRA